jgi:hypothetical protein
MTGEEINDAIKKYCEKMKYFEAFGTMNNVESFSSENLQDMFENFYEGKCENKLSFTFTVSNKQSLLKKRLANMNEDENKSDKAPKTKRLKTSDESVKIPESFLTLLDELCIDRKNAKLFYENPRQWTYVKSDRKIYCTKKGKYYKHCMSKVLFGNPKKLQSRSFEILKIGSSIFEKNSCN